MVMTAPLELNPEAGKRRASSLALDAYSLSLGLVEAMRKRPLFSPHDAL